MRAVYFVGNVKFIVHLKGYPIITRPKGFILPCINNPVETNMLNILSCH